MTLLNMLSQLGLATILGALALLLILFCLFMVLRLKRQIPGGIIGKRWNTLTALVVLFVVGYTSVFFLQELPAEQLLLIITSVYLFGAIYVWLTIRMVYSIIRELTE
ncbi:MAG: hypothetical protein OEX12_08425 [Gammaproteobacteria bacterium]|nr:hypothetical protein [Gammaproteobacteria bacterium]